MQTTISPELLAHAEIAEADAILRSCVHCGFCNATCPTYQLVGNELDGPRGRIYLIKEMLEGNLSSDKTQLHLDRCLTCRACETTCPSGVQYGRLVDIGRQEIEKRVPRSVWQKILRRTLLAVLPYPRRFVHVLGMSRMVRPLLPLSLQRKIPARQRQKPVHLQAIHLRKMLVLDGCVQSLSAPNINMAAAGVLNKLGVSLISASRAGCCGALNQHLADMNGARGMMRRNIDAWWPYIEAGAEAIVMTASGCGLMVKEYGTILKNDPVYAAKAARISGLTYDLGEILQREDLSAFADIGKGVRVAYQSSCTSQHGQKLSGVIEAILQNCGYTLSQVADSHLCCGAAGTYTLLQPEWSQKLLEKKLDALQQGGSEFIATANIGCKLHLESAARLPVKHWIELLHSFPQQVGD